MRRVVWLVLALLLLCAACGKEEQKTEEGYQLYFTVASQSGHGSAVESESFDPAGCTTVHPEGESCPSPGDLMKALWSGPTREGLFSPFPRGTTLRRWKWDGERTGNVQIWLSEQYGGLADISLTLADYCIVLTLSQLPEVESVEIIAEGHTANYRSHQLLRPEEVILDGA